MTETDSKHGIVARPPYVLYMMFADLGNFVRFLPEDKKKGIQAEYDTLMATVQGFSVGIKVDERVPYSRISYMDYGAPFAFHIELYFDSDNGAQDRTDFHIHLSADLNFMMKAMLGSRIKEALDKLVDGVVAMSEGRMPEGVDPSMFPQGFDPEKAGGFKF